MWPASVLGKYAHVFASPTSGPLLPSVTPVPMVPVPPLPELSATVVEPAISPSRQYSDGASASTAAGYAPPDPPTPPCATSVPVSLVTSVTAGLGPAWAAAAPATKAVRVCVPLDDAGAVAPVANACLSAMQ